MTVRVHEWCTAWHDDIVVADNQKRFWLVGVLACGFLAGSLVLVSGMMTYGLAAFVIIEVGAMSYTSGSFAKHYLMCDVLRRSGGVRHKDSRAEERLLITIVAMLAAIVVLSFAILLQPGLPYEWSRGAPILAAAGVGVLSDWIIGSDNAKNYGEQLMFSASVSMMTVLLGAPMWG
jgi:hypothetical protein